MALRSKWRVGGMTLMVAVLGLGASLGGCSSVSKDEHGLVVQEASELREKNAALEQESRNQASQISDLQSQLSNARTAQAAVQQPDFRSAGSGGSGSGGGSNFDTDSRGRIAAEIAGDVLFSSGQATLKADSQKKLDSIARELNGRYSGNNVLIEGHTDSDPLVKSKAKWGSNQGLSKARADAVRVYLQSKGVSGSRMDTVGRGSSDPKGSKAASRRVEIIIGG